MFDSDALKKVVPAVVVSATLGLCLGLGIDAFSQSRGVSAANTIAHSGFLAKEGRPHNGEVELEVQLFVDNEPVYKEQEKVRVTDGHYALVLGDGEPAAFARIPFATAKMVELGVTIIEGRERVDLEPRQVLRAAPVALSVVPGAIGTQSLADASVTGQQIAEGTISGEHLENGSVNFFQLADDAVGQNKLKTGAVGTDQLQAHSIVDHHISPTAGALIHPGRVYTVTESATVAGGNLTFGEARCEAGDVRLTGACYNVVDIELKATRLLDAESGEGMGYSCGYFNADASTGQFEVQVSCLRIGGAQ